MPFPVILGGEFFADFGATHQYSNTGPTHIDFTFEGGRKERISMSEAHTNHHPPTVLYAAQEYVVKKESS